VQIDFAGRLNMNVMHSTFCRLFMLLLTIGLAISSWVLLAFMSGGCDGIKCELGRQAIPQTEEVAPLTIFVSVASYRDSECKDTMQACPSAPSMHTTSCQLLITQPVARRHLLPAGAMAEYQC